MDTIVEFIYNGISYKCPISSISVLHEKLGISHPNNTASSTVPLAASTTAPATGMPVPLAASTTAPATGMPVPLAASTTAPNNDAPEESVKSLDELENDLALAKIEFTDDQSKFEEATDKLKKAQQAVISEFGKNLTFDKKLNKPMIDKIAKVKKEWDDSLTECSTINTESKDAQKMFEDAEKVFATAEIAFATAKLASATAKLALLKDNTNDSLKTALKDAEEEFSKCRKNQEDAEKKFLRLNLTRLLW